MLEYDLNYKQVKQYSIIAQKIIISNEENNILLLQRSEKSGRGGQWSLAGGGLDNGEEPVQGILREIAEEIQVVVTKPIPFYIKSRYKEDDFIVIIAYEATYKSGEVILNWEHDNFKWLSKDDALEYDLTPDAKSIIKKWHK